MQTLDQMAIKELGIPGVVLMENAGFKVVENIQKMIGNLQGKKFSIFAGKGNNGGDGFVIARHLLNAGAEAKVLLFADPNEIAGDARINLNILQKMGGSVLSVIRPNSLNLIKLTMAYTDLVVDAVFGTGFKGIVPAQTGEVFKIINASGKPVLSVDIPSGLEADTGQVYGPCIRAARTVTFAQAKLGLVIQQGPEYTGELVIADISIPPGLVNTLGIKRFFTTPAMVKGLLPVRDSASHKGTFGRILVIGGSLGLSGAPAMTSMAALRAGAGLVTLAVPASIHSSMEVKLTEVMTRPLPETQESSISLEALPEILRLSKGIDVLALGPGMSGSVSTVDLVRRLVSEVKVPMVIDADGLNALAGTGDFLKTCPAPLILTPHPGEMARLLGIKTEEVQNNRIGTALAAAQKFNAIVVLKGFRTIVAGPDGTVYINPTGNAGMGSGGTGDVLTGIIAGFLGQGLGPLESAVAGVYIHGAAGDLAAREKGMSALIAGDLLEYLPTVTREYESRP